jgi:hypothetical protein
MTPIEGVDFDRNDRQISKRDFEAIESNVHALMQLERLCVRFDPHQGRVLRLGAF